MKKRLLSLLLVLCMVLAMVPSVFAEEAYDYCIQFDLAEGETWVFGDYSAGVPSSDKEAPIPDDAVLAKDGYCFWAWQDEDGNVYTCGSRVTIPDGGVLVLKAVWNDHGVDADGNGFCDYCGGCGHTKDANGNCTVEDCSHDWETGHRCCPKAEEPDTDIPWTDLEPADPVYPVHDDHRVYINDSLHGDVETKYSNRWYEAGDRVWLKVSPDKGYQLASINAYDYWYGYDWDWDWNHYGSECDCPYCNCYYCGNDCDCSYCHDWYWGWDHDYDCDCWYCDGYDYGRYHDYGCDCWYCDRYYHDHDCDEFDCDFFVPSRWYDCEHTYDCDCWYGWNWDHDDWYGHDLNLTYQGDGWYTFIMPDCDVYVDATFELVGKSNLPFYDVPALAWYYDAVEYVYNRELMNGVDYRTFAPNAGADRAMIATILYRMEGEPAVHAKDSFADVVKNSYYEDAVLWAASKGIVTGYPNGTFAPNKMVTREELVSILYRYADYKNRDVDDGASLAGFVDAEAVRGYALKAVKWAVAEDLLNGNEYGRLMPGVTATRAQIAQIFKAFCENVW